MYYWSEINPHWMMIVNRKIRSRRFDMEIRNWIYYEFIMKWLGHLITSVFCLWEHLKFPVYITLVHDVKDLKNRIICFMIGNSLKIFERIRGSLRRRTESYFVTGGYFKKYYKEIISLIFQSFCLSIAR